jgi:hypothetical protein
MIVAITCAQSDLLMCLIRPTTDGDNNQFIYFLKHNVDIVTDIYTGTT